MYRLLAIAFLTISVNGQIQLAGKCDFAVKMANFNLTQFMNSWYQISRIENEYEKGDCSSSVYAQYETTVNNGTVVNREVVDKKESWRNGTFTLKNEGHYEFAYSGYSLNTIVLNTDYTSYGLLYSCRQVNDTLKLVWAWQLSRTKDLTESGKTSLNATITNNADLKNAVWRSVAHTDAACDTSSAINSVLSPALFASVLLLITLASLE